MKIIRPATSHQQPDLHLEADGGDFRPDTIILFHNGKTFEYRIYSETIYYPGEFSKPKLPSTSREIKEG